MATGNAIQSAAPVAASSITVLTTAGDLLIENATPANARLPVGTAGQMLGLSGSPLLPAWGMALTQLATTGNSGYTLINGTGTILTWTAPNDGNLHRVLIFGEINVTSLETGGQINVAYTDVSGAAQNQQLLAAGLNIGVTSFNSLPRQMIMIKPGVTVNLTQASALTGGASVLYSEIWGS